MKTAVITGASSGLGREFVRQFYSVFPEIERVWLIARRTDRLQELAEQLEEKGISTLTLPLDLCDTMSFTAYQEHLVEEQPEIALLVNNAGFGIFGRFTETNLQEEMDLLAVNVRALHILTKLFLKKFQAQKHGRILNVASSAGFLTGPLLSSYYASKNYVVRLSLAIAEELRRQHSPVTMSILCPGPVDTNFNARAGVSFSVPPMSSQQVAAYALEKTMEGKLLIVPGVGMKLALFGARFVPHTWLSAITYEVQKKKLK